MTEIIFFFINFLSFYMSPQERERQMKLHALSVPKENVPDYLAGGRRTDRHKLLFMKIIFLYKRFRNWLEAIEW